MKQIREVIVVEGKNDTARLRRWFDCETIETGGLSLNEETLDLIRTVQERRGVIIFTDPDSPGNRIRDRINKAVPGCKNAFAEKKRARTEKKVGVEHAEKEMLEEALANLVTYTETPHACITAQDMFELGLSGADNSAQLRTKLGAYLHIGDANARTFRSRLSCLGITREELEKAIAYV